MLETCESAQRGIHARRQTSIATYRDPIKCEGSMAKDATRKRLRKRISRKATRRSAPLPLEALGVVCGVLGWVPPLGLLAAQGPRGRFEAKNPDDGRVAKELDENLWHAPGTGAYAGQRHARAHAPWHAA